MLTRLSLLGIVLSLSATACKTTSGSQVKDISTPIPADKAFEAVIPRGWSPTSQSFYVAYMRCHAGDVKCSVGTTVQQMHFFRYHPAILELSKEGDAARDALHNLSNGLMVTSVHYPREFATLLKPFDPKNKQLAYNTDPKAKGLFLRYCKQEVGPETTLCPDYRGNSYAGNIESLDKAPIDLGKQEISEANLKKLMTLEQYYAANKMLAWTDRIKCIRENMASLLDAKKRLSEGKVLSQANTGSNFIYFADYIISGEAAPLCPNNPAALEKEKQEMDIRTKLN